MTLYCPWIPLVFELCPFHPWVIIPETISSVRRCLRNQDNSADTPPLPLEMEHTYFMVSGVVFKDMVCCTPEALGTRISRSQ